MAAIDVRDLGYYMPGEWAPHTCCWMAWPCRDGMWASESQTRQDYANLANMIARFEPVKMCVPPHKLDEASVLLGDGVEIVEMMIDDSWARDSGPNFLIGGDIVEYNPTRDINGMTAMVAAKLAKELAGRIIDGR